MNSRDIIASNLTSLMQASKTFNTQTKVAAKAAVDQKTISRLLRKQQSPTVEMVECIANAFGLEAWQMLIPSLDPTDPPVVQITRSEMELYERLRQAALAMSATGRADGGL